MNRTGNMFRIVMLLTALMFAAVETLHPLLHDCCGEVAGEFCAGAGDGADAVYSSPADSGAPVLKAESFCPVCGGFAVCTVPVPAKAVVPVVAPVPVIRPVAVYDPPGKTVLLPLAPRPPPVC